jgi:hypothetical protein
VSARKSEARGYSYRMASQREYCSSLLGVAYLYSLNLCCLLFFLSFSFSLARICIWAVPPLAHRVWVIEGIRKRGIEVVVGRAADDRLNLASEARHEFVVAMIGRYLVDSMRACKLVNEARGGIGNFQISGARARFLMPGN